MQLFATPAAVQRGFRVAICLYAVALMLAITPYTNDPAGDIKWLITSCFAGALVILWSVAALQGRIPFHRPRLFPELMAGFMLLYLVATLRSEFPGVSFVELQRFAALVLLWFLVSQVFLTPRHAMQLFAAVCAAATLAACYGMAQKFGWDPFPWEDKTGSLYARLPASFGNPNFAGHVMILAVILGAALAFTPGWRWASAFALLPAIHLYFIQQRAAFVALAAAAAIALIAHLAGRRMRLAPAGIAATLGLCLLLGAGAAGAVMAWNHWRTGTVFPLDTSILIRYVSYVSASEMIVDAPLLGHGPGVYALKYPIYWTPFEQEWFAQQLKMNQHVHNDLMEIAIDAGIAAAGIYLAMLVLGICQGLLIAFRDPSRRAAGYAFAAFFTAFLVDGLFGFNLRTPASAVLCFLALGMLERFWRPVSASIEAPGVPGFGGKAWRVALAGAAALLILFQTALFTAEARLLQGMRAQYQNNLPEAQRRFEDGWRLAPWNWHFPRRLGQVAMAAGEYDTAVKQFDAALERNPYYIMTFVPLAHVRMAKAQRMLATEPEDLRNPLEQLVLAGDAAREALALAPMLPLAEDILGRVASMTALTLMSPGSRAPREEIERHWQEAEEYLMRALRHGASNQADLYRMVAKVRVARGDHQIAEEALVRAVQANPADTASWQFFYEFAMGNERFDLLNNELQRQIERLEGQAPRDEHTLATMNLWLAKVLEQGFGDLRGADAAFAGALEHGPLRPEVWANFAIYAAQRHRLPVFLDALQGAIAARRAAGEPVLGYVAGVADVLQQGAPALDGATTSLLNAFRQQEDQPDLPLAVGLGWAAEILLAQAEQAALEEASEAFCRAYLNLGIMFAMLEQLPLAEGLFSQAAPCIDEDLEPHLRIHWADTLMRLERTQAALELLEEGHARAPGHLDLHWALARTYAAAGNIPAAEEAYDSLLAAPGVTHQGRARLQEELEALR